MVPTFTDESHHQRAFRKKKERGTNQSSTSALPVNAWQIIITLSLVSFSLPHVLYAIGTFFKLLPDSKIKEGTTNVSCSSKEAKWEVMVQVELQEVKSLHKRPVQL